VTSLEPRTLHQPEKLQNVSKNDYVSTPSIFNVNQNPQLLTCHFSIECSGRTGGCIEIGAARMGPLGTPNVSAVLARCFRTLRQGWLLE